MQGSLERICSRSAPKQRSPVYSRAILDLWRIFVTQTRSRLEEVVKQSPRKWVYLFSEGNAKMRDLLGGKGAVVDEMTNAGLPVPPGFTITTEACNAYYESNKHFPPGMWEQALAALKILEQQTGKGFGRQDNPL